MINQQLLAPRSIVVVGASDDIEKPGGKILKNIIDGNFQGKLYANNLKSEEVQGIRSYRSLEDLPEQVDLAILAVAAKYCPASVEILAKTKGTKAFIIISAGFSEENKEGQQYEEQVVDTVNEVGGALIGPNCIGVMNTHYAGVFTTPIPALDAQGVDFISGSGATAVFIMEAGMKKGLRFNSVFSVGNSAQMGVEEVLEYMDEHYEEGVSSRVKLLYLESVSAPQKLLKHARSLIAKGCKIAAIKAGRSEAGSRAASSHTGALASSDVAVDALFRKAGIIRCYGREDLVQVASIFMLKPLKGKNIAVITHAGGPAVMLTDSLSDGGFQIPAIEGEKAETLREKLFPGSSVANPIDFLATGTAEQLGHIIDACENDFDHIDAMAVIFGSPGLFSVREVYEVLNAKMKSCKKPIFPILPSVVNAAEDITHFLNLGNGYFSDEVQMAEALTKVYGTELYLENPEQVQPLPVAAIRDFMERQESGYLAPEAVQQLLDWAGIPRVKEVVSEDWEVIKTAAETLGYPLVMKVVGPIHKSDVGGVRLNIQDENELKATFEDMMQIEGSQSVMIQAMLTGKELFIGASYEPDFGHTVLCGMGGVFIEVLKDVSAALSPVTKTEALRMIEGLKSYAIIEGVRGQAGVNKDLYADVIVRLSQLLEVCPEIKELDLNPLLGTPEKVVAVDARIRIEI